MPLRDGRRKLFHGRSLSATQDNKLRHIYIMCLLLFNTNSSCCMPLHFLLTEAILCHGGSMELVCLFNRLGIEASLDTNSRYATYVVEKRITEGIKPCMQDGILTVDNVDILQSNAVVSSLDATRSWHGTSVQCIQPLPKSEELSLQELVITTCACDQDRFQSPIPVQRQKRRRRTIIEACSPHTQMVVPRHEVIKSTYTTITSDLNLQELTCPSMTLSNFLPDCNREN